MRATRIRGEVLVVFDLCFLLALILVWGNFFVLVGFGFVLFFGFCFWFGCCFGLCLVWFGVVYRWFMGGLLAV